MKRYLWGRLHAYGWILGERTLVLQESRRLNSLRLRSHLNSFLLHNSLLHFHHLLLLLHFLADHRSARCCNFCLSRSPSSSLLGFRRFRVVLLGPLRCNCEKRLRGFFDLFNLLTSGFRNGGNGAVVLSLPSRLFILLCRILLNNALREKTKYFHK